MEALGRLITAALALVLAAVALAGCGEDAVKSLVPGETVAEAADKTARVAGMRFESRGEMTVPELGTHPYTASGVLDMRGERSRMRMDMSSFGEAVAEEAGEAGGEPEDWKMDMVLDGDVMYMRFPLLERELDGKSWIKVDLARTLQGAGIDPSLLQAGASDPSQTLRFLRATSDEVEEVGRETVGGVETTHYRATVELRKYPDLVPAKDREKARATVDRLIELSGTETQEVEVWIGADKLVRRMKTTMSMKIAGTGERMDITDTTEFSDFGARVVVEPPPASEVRDVTDEAARSAGQLEP